MRYYCFKMGVFSEAKNEKRCKTSLKNWGVKHPSQNQIIIGVKNVPEIWYIDENNIEHRYYVDIFIPSQNKCIEVKSLYTYNKNKKINCYE